MAAIARSAVLAVSLACLVQASAHDDVLEVVTNMATGLTTVNIPLFMSAFDKEMPGYDTLESNVSGIYLAGVIIAGMDTNEIFIENGRFHGKQILGDIEKKL